MEVGDCHSAQTHIILHLMHRDFAANRLVVQAR